MVDIKNFLIKPLFTALLLLSLAGFSLAAQPRAGRAAPTAEADGAALPTQIRVLVAMGPSTYFFRDGRPHGVEYSWLLELENFLNQGRDKSRAVHVQMIPLEPSELIPALFDGRGEMAAGLLPVSEGVRQLAHYTEPVLQDRWCVYRNRAAAEVDSADQLAGQGAKVMMTGYGRRVLGELNESRRLAGKTELALDDAGLSATQEKLLFDVGKDPGKYSLSSQFVATLWGNLLPKVEPAFCLDNPVPLAWVVRKEQTALLAAVNRFLAAKKSTLVRRGIDLTRRHLHPSGVGKPSRLIDPLDKLSFFAPILQFAAKANGLDWLLLAAIGQKESGLTAVVSKQGPTGLMQVDPATARQMGIKNPHDTTQNVTAAARYLSYLREQFTSPQISEEDQLYFMLAAYNAGEGRVKNLRDKAVAQGLDPNRWAGHVEKVARQSVGKRMTDYVMSVSRYYYAYQNAERKRSAESARASRTAARSD